YLIQNKIEDANALLNELLKEHPMYTSFIFVSLDDTKNVKEKDNYLERLQKLKSHFLEINDDDLKDSPSVVLSQIRLLKSEGRSREAFELLNDWLKEFDNNSDVLKIEFIKLLIETGNHEKALEETQILLSNLHSSLTRHFCSQCGFNSDEIFWRCPQCHKWETIQFRWKV
ncbi:MAG: hypothetical protein CME66_12280, partial [Halobacteriovoraceae bacterium]|nr:hypothetical protein [Halobacteriovoraceae bacterium]